MKRKTTPVVKKAPQFARWLLPIVEALKQRGNAGRAREITGAVIEACAGSSEEVTTDGLARIKNQIHWARFYLVRAGFLDGTERGVWKLTEAGQRAAWDTDSIRSTLTTVRRLPRVNPEAPTFRRPRVPAAFRHISSRDGISISV